uniref:Monooxygenase n=1 Tax=Gongylonema pulchrum TaxID=637853 RepID=A0A183EXU6_9BILA
LAPLRKPRRWTSAEKFAWSNGFSGYAIPIWPDAIPTWSTTLHVWSYHETRIHAQKAI